MDDKLYVIFGKDGIDRTRATEPNASDLRANQGYFILYTHVDDEYFEDAPAPEVEVDIPVDKVVEPQVGVDIVDPAEPTDGDTLDDA